MTSVRHWTGRESRALRHALRLSVRSFADQLGVGYRTVGRWDAGGDDAELRPDSQACLDTMFSRADVAARERFQAVLGDVKSGASVEIVDSGDSVALATPSPQRPWDSILSASTVDLGSSLMHPILGANTGPNEQYNEDDVNRRRFLQTFTALGVGSLPRLEALRHDLFSAIGGDAADAAEWDMIAWEYGSTYATTPPLQLVRQLTVDLIVARDHLNHVHNDPQRRSLHRVIAQLAAYMAQSAGNLGNLRESIRWWRAARQAADISSHPDVQVWVRGREVIRGLYEHRVPESLLALADEAMAITSRPGMGTGSVLCGRAQALAMLGRVDDAREALIDLYELTDRLPARVVSDIDTMYGWPEFRTRHTESFVFTQIGDHQRAETAQDLAIPMYPESMARERTQVQLHRAMRLIRTGDATTGAAVAVESVVSMPEDQRIEAVLEVARWAAASVPSKDRRHAEVGQLRELLALPAGASS